MKWLRRNPFIRILIPFIIGLVLARNLPSSANAFALSLVVLPAIIISTPLFKCNFSFQIYSTLLLSFPFFLGVAIYLLSNLEPPGVKELYATKGEEVLIAIDIHDIPENEKTTRFKGSIKAFRSVAGQFFKTNVKTLIVLNEEFLGQKISSGDRILANGRVFPIHSILNPHSFNYARYLRDRNIFTRIYIKQGDIISQYRPQAPWYYIRHDMRPAAIGSLKKYVNPSELGLCSALILGYRQFLSTETTRMFQDTGSIHVLAVSGLHVGILIYSIFFLFRIFRISGPILKHLELWIGVLSLLIFVELTGGSPSVLRASLIAILYLIGRRLKKPLIPSNLLAFICFGLLVYNPNFLYSVGFQLSFLAVVGILVLYPILRDLFPCTNPLLRYIRDLISIAVSAQVFTFPLSLYYFHQFPVYFILSSIIAVLHAHAILIGGLTLVISSTFSISMASWLGSVVSVLSKSFRFCIKVLDQIPGKLIDEIWLNPLEVILVYLVISSFVLFFKRQTFLRLTLFLVTCTILSFSRMVFEISTMRQKKVTIYDHSLFCADVFIGNTGYSFIEAGLSREQIDWLSGNHRLANRIYAVEEFMLDDLRLRNQ